MDFTIFLLFCFDNLNDLLLYGNFNTDNGQWLTVNVEPCNLGKQCKDIKNLYSDSNWPYLVTILNN